MLEQSPSEGWFNKFGSSLGILVVIVQRVVDKVLTISTIHPSPTPNAHESRAWCELLRLVSHHFLEDWEFDSGDPLSDGTSVLSGTGRDRVLVTGGHSVVVKVISQHFGTAWRESTPGLCQGHPKIITLHWDCHSRHRTWSWPQGHTKVNSARVLLYY